MKSITEARPEVTEQIAERENQLQKWEYCAIGNLAIGNEVYTSNPRLIKFTTNGGELVTDFKQRQSKVKESDAVAQSIAQLGNEGWELVGVGDSASLSGGCTLFFKRPKTSQTQNPQK